MIPELCLPDPQNEFPLCNPAGTLPLSDDPSVTSFLSIPVSHSGLTSDVKAKDG